VVILYSVKKTLLLVSLLFLPLLLWARTHTELGNDYSQKASFYYEEAVKEYLAAKEAGEEIGSRLARLYFEHGDYKKAIEELVPLYRAGRRDLEILRLLTLSYYKTESYLSSLSIFEEIEDTIDPEILYCYGRTCEMLNLFDRALEVYSKINDIDYLPLVKERIFEINLEQGLTRPEDREIKILVKNAPTQQDFPNAGAVILLNDEQFKINLDFTATYESHIVVKILNERGKDYAEIGLDYESIREKAEFLYARMIKPNGQVVEIEEGDVKDVVKYFDYPLYSNVRTKIISMPEVEDDCIIDYKARWEITELLNQKDFSYILPLQGQEPVFHQKFTLVLPKGYEFRAKGYDPGYTRVEIDFNPIKEERDGWVYYRWNFGQAPEIIDEPFMPPYAEAIPYFAISSFKDWKDIYQWWKSVYEDKLLTDEEMERKIEELLDGTSDDWAKAKAIYEFCAKEVRYVAVEYGEAGFKPHSAIETFKNRYGDCKDQAILLVSMLRSAGLKAYPVLITTEGSWPVDAEFASLVFNHALGCVEIEGRLIFLDPTQRAVSFGDLPLSAQGRGVLIFYDDTYEITSIPVFPSKHNLFERKTEMVIKEDKSIAGKRALRFKGFYEQQMREWLISTKPALVKEALQEMINALTPGGRLIDYRISKFEDLNSPLELEMEFEGPSYLLLAGEHYLIPQLGGISARLVSKEDRIYPLKLNAEGEYLDEVWIKIPPNFRVDHFPPKITIETDWLDYTHAYAFEDGVITFTERKVDKKARVDTTDYKEFKQIYEALARGTEGQVVLTEIVSAE